MYIPGWLLVIGIVVGLFAFKRLRTTAGAALGWGILIVIGLLLLGWIGLSIYFIVTGQHAEAFVVVGLPLIGLVICGSIINARSLRDDKGRIKVDTLRARLQEHQRKITAADGPAEIVEARFAFARELKLGQTLFFLSKHIENYPAWYEQGGNEEAPWSSSVIPRTLIARLDMLAMEQFGFTVADEAADDDCLCYAFSAFDKGYAFCAFAETVPDVTLAATAGATLQAMKVCVIELPETVVLEALILYETTPTHFRYRHENIAAFKPGEWLVELMSVADRVSVEYAARVQAEQQERDQEQARRFA